MNNRSFQLYVVSTGRQSLERFCQIAVQIAPYVTAFHLRERLTPAVELYEACQLLVSSGVPLEKLIVNDRLDVATASGVSSVQLAWHSLPVGTVKASFPQLTVGKSVHCIGEARRAEADGSDYLMYGHIFATQSKPDIVPRGLEALQQLISAVEIPVIAIGGIQPQHVPSLVQSGAAGIAVMSGILEAEDCLRAVQAYDAAIQKARLG